ncbi:hypothetical protein [Arthrobacter sp. STN4]|uniref:hypothetical protein n=1 Tax=Arthrobacter sp. STN4 TaxID=2923276 RepID=UPI00211A1061|nr:hypothetical protein [Arthrobacter sp. STN4]MCQ9163638.1 hypothetical protein [Arthrobacter sp. STN4]
MAGGRMLVLALWMVAAALLPGHAAPAEIVVNGGMENGTSGWRSHDAPSAWVRTDTPGITGQLRVTQSNGARTITGRSFHLAGTSWAHVKFTYSSTVDGPAVDVGVVSWGLKPGQHLIVDEVSMRQIPGAAPAPVAASRTVFGSSLGMSSSCGSLPMALAREEARFGTLGAVRKFDDLLPASWESMEPLAGRSLIISFQPPPADVLAGTYDEQLLDWFRQAPATTETYWSYIHEPEARVSQGQFTTAQYRAAWRRIAGLSRQANNPRLHSTLILMGWTANPDSRLYWLDYYPGGDYIDVTAWDAHNDAGSVAGPLSYPDPGLVFGPSVAASKSVNKPYAVAETGSRLIPTDPSGVGRAAWLTKVGAFVLDNEAVFVTYWDSAVGSGDYRLVDAPSAAAWRALVAPRADWEGSRWLMSQESGRFVDPYIHPGTDFWSPSCMAVSSGGATIETIQ